MKQETTRGAERPHPRKEPRLPLPLSPEGLEQVFDGCADLQKRQVRLAGSPERQVTVYWLAGMAKTERINDYVFRPLAQDRQLPGRSRRSCWPC